LKGIILYSRYMGPKVKRYVATAEEVIRIALERPDSNITYDAWGTLAIDAESGIFITDRNPLDDGNGPFILTEVVQDTAR